MASTYLPEQDALFLHLPKTAGFSISTALGEVPGARPCPVRGMGRVVGAARYAEGRLGRRVFEEAWSFAVVRNPWDWTVSGWKYATQNTDAYPGGGPSFEDFLTGGWRRGLERNPSHLKFKRARAFVRYHCFVTQWEHLCDARGRLVPLAYTARFERLEEDLPVIAERLGVPLDIPHRNKSERRPYRDYYTPTLTRLVAEANAPLIRRFGYEF